MGTRAVLTTTPVPPQTVAVFGFLAVAGVALPLAVTRVEWPRLREVLPGLVAISAAFAVGVHLVAVSFDLATAGVAPPIINTQVTIVVLLGSLLLDEGQLGRRVGAAGLAVVGVALVAAGCGSSSPGRVVVSDAQDGPDALRLALPEDEPLARLNQIGPELELDRRRARVAGE